MHEPSSLPGKPTDETPGKGRNRSWQPSGLETPSAVPAERHFKRRYPLGGRLARRRIPIVRDERYGIWLLASRVIFHHAGGRLARRRIPIVTTLLPKIKSLPSYSLAQADFNVVVDFPVASVVSTPALSNH